MIDPEDYYKQEELYMREGKLWRVLAYCPGPSITMMCIGSQEKINFGVGGLCDKEFKKVEEHNGNT